ncbi:hypothetical protein NUSPORA_02252 [Nucleospora cyclopteri]
MKFYHIYNLGVICSKPKKVRFDSIVKVQNISSRSNPDIIETTSFIEILEEPIKEECNNLNESTRRHDHLNNTTGYLNLINSHITRCYDRIAGFIIYLVELICCFNSNT